MALKELGFEEKCFYYWNVNTVNKRYHLNKVRNTGETHYSTTEYGKYPLNFFAPIYQQAFRWFREKHKLHSRVDIQDVELDWYSFEILEVKDGEYNNDLHLDSNFKSHEEAELACLRKLIEIVKNK